MNKEKQQEIKEMFTVKNKWYHKIPYVGKKIHNKQVRELYEMNKYKLFKIIENEINEDMLKVKDEIIKESVNELNNCLDIKYMTIKNKNLDKYKIICDKIKLR